LSQRPESDAALLVRLKLVSVPRFPRTTGPLIAREQAFNLGDYGSTLLFRKGDVPDKYFDHTGWSSTALGRPQEGLELLTDGLSVIRSTGTVQCTPWVLILLAEAHRKVGQSTKGLSCLAEAEAIVAATDEQCAFAELHRLKGELLEAGGDQSAAETNYRRALYVAQRQSAKIFELRAATSLARLWRDQGKRTEARDLLALIYGWFTEGFDTPVLQDAKALLDELV
jgi:predicted ATPase